MPRLVEGTLICLSIFLGMFFFFHGFMKVSPLLNREIHMNLRKCFARYVKVIPIFTQLGIRVQARHYRLSIGVIEMIFGLLLAWVPGKIKQTSNLVLLVLTWGAIYTHVMVNDDTDSKFFVYHFLVYNYLQSQPCPCLPFFHSNDVRFHLLGFVVASFLSALSHG